MILGLHYIYCIHFLFLRTLNAASFSFFSLSLFSHTWSIDIRFQPLQEAISKKLLIWFVYQWSIVLFSHRRSLLRKMPDRNLLSFIIRVFWVDEVLPREALQKLRWDRQKDSTVDFYHFISNSMLSKLFLRGSCVLGCLLLPFQSSGLMQARICIFKWFFYYLLAKKLMPNWS